MSDDYFSITTEPVGISDEFQDVPHQYALYQNVPNPFIHRTTIRYEVQLWEASYTACLRCVGKTRADAGR